MLRLLLVILAVCELLNSGCGTFSDTMCGPVNPDPAENPVFYRGVRFDVTAINEGGPKVLMAADIPLSAIADTILVPFIAYDELTKPRPQSLQSKNDEEKAVQPKADPISVANPKN
jgi:uncharacterized protein YceK